MSGNKRVLNFSVKVVSELRSRGMHSSDPKLFTRDRSSWTPFTQPPTPRAVFSPGTIAYRIPVRTVLNLHKGLTIYNRSWDPVNKCLDHGTEPSFTTPTKPLNANQVFIIQQYRRTPQQVNVQYKSDLLRFKSSGQRLASAE